MPLHVAPNPKAGYLAASPLFIHLSEAQLQQVAARFQTASFEPGAPIVEMGCMADRLWLIAQGGVVRATRISAIWTAARAVARPRRAV